MNIRYLIPKHGDLPFAVVCTPEEEGQNCEVVINKSERTWTKRYGSRCSNEVIEETTPIGELNVRCSHVYAHVIGVFDISDPGQVDKLIAYVISQGAIIASSNEAVSRREY